MAGASEYARRARVSQDIFRNGDKFAVTFVRNLGRRGLQKVIHYGDSYETLMDAFAARDEWLSIEHKILERDPLYWHKHTKDSVVPYFSHENCRCILIDKQA